jgi:hypothetical protein
MCLASLESATRLIRAGEIAEIGLVANYHGGKVKAVVPIVPEPLVSCLCVKEGYRLRFTNLPVAFISRHALAGPFAGAIFREAGVNRRRTDMVEFDNTTTVKFTDLPEGVRVYCVSANQRQVGAEAVEKSLATNAAITETEEPVLVGAGGCNRSRVPRVHPGVLGTTARRVVAAGVTGLSAVAIAVLVLH